MPSTKKDIKLRSMEPEVCGKSIHPTGQDSILILCIALLISCICGMLIPITKWKDHKEDGVIEKVNAKYIFARDKGERSQFIHKCHRERNGPLKTS